jgi:hypothetical protein
MKLIGEDILGNQMQVFVPVCHVVAQQKMECMEFHSMVAIKN